jgi:hypothetical protein
MSLCFVHVNIGVLERVLSWRMHGCHYAWSTQTLGFWKGCYRGECMDVVMFDPRKHWGSGKGVIVENAWIL